MTGLRSSTTERSASACTVDDPEQGPGPTLLGPVSSALGRAGLQAVLFGGEAVNFWSEPRATHDVDLMLPADGPAVRRFVADLLETGFALVRQQDDGSPSGPDFLRLVHTMSGHGLDIEVAKTDYQDLIFERGVQSLYEGVLVVSPEDLLILKLLANRHRDIADLDVIGKRPGLDWGYVERWARFWEVEGRYLGLRSALDEEAARIRDLHGGQQPPTEEP